MRRRHDWHRQAGHRVVIVSASPTVYLDAAGRRLGVDAVLATELEVGADGRLTGRLAGPNCRGEEKVKRLQAWLDGSGREGFLGKEGSTRGRCIGAEVRHRSERYGGYRINDET